LINESETNTSDATVPGYFVLAGVNRDEEIEAHDGIVDRDTGAQINQKPILQEI
jgi:hypothetical protein